MTEVKGEYTTEEIEKREQAKKDSAIVTRLAAMFEANKDTVGVPKIFVDICNDLEAAMVLDELFFWTLPKKGTGKTSLRVRKAGVLWLAVHRKDWWDRKRLSVRQADNAIAKLIDLDFVEKDLFLFNGKPTTHLRLKMANFIPLYLEKLAQAIPPEEDDSESLINDINDLYAMMGASILPNRNPISPNGNMLISPNGELINSTVSVSTTSIEDSFLQRKRTSKKGDLVDGALAFLPKDKTVDIEKVLARLDKTFGLNLPRNPDWQSLAKFILEQTNPTLDQWITWYISDDFRMTSSIHITTDKIRMWWPKAHRVERPIQKPVEKEDEVYVTDLKERIEKLRKERENETNL
jgi:hypothetical protein